MTQREYCELSDLETNQCHHCTTQARTLGPIDGGLYLEDEED